MLLNLFRTLLSVLYAIPRQRIAVQNDPSQKETQRCVSYMSTVGVFQNSCAGLNLRTPESITSCAGMNTNAERELERYDVLMHHIYQVSSPRSVIGQNFTALPSDYDANNGNC
jgi:hypothetical protein